MAPRDGWRGARMDEWLNADPASLVDEVVTAKWMTGEEVDGDDPAARLAVGAEIARAQADLRGEVEAGPDGRILVHREMALSDEALDALAPGDALGICWAFDRKGAHGYDARAGGARRVVTAWAEPGDVAWAQVLAAWSSGEGEARLAAGAGVELVGIADRDGTPRRADLAGSEFGTARTLPTGPSPR